ncbi:hypothetical protein [Streptomyces sp. SID3343]|uniref:hypothetical protein n=1 Tax=Streptomyces sp. SID3343 TaxID=2690260 RepID=UPI00136FDFAD|nr:hypothetical protein [Streptomyces sp. SID3343]MYW05485.1 hypothetical protein [Streptomyces sp. SID3343]
MPLPDRLAPLLSRQLEFERVDRACHAAAEAGDDAGLGALRARRLDAMWNLITARDLAGAASAEDRLALKNAALAELAASDAAASATATITSPATQTIAKNADETADAGVDSHS